MSNLNISSLYAKHSIKQAPVYIVGGIWYGWFGTSHVSKTTQLLVIVTNPLFQIRHMHATLGML